MGLFFERDPHQSSLAASLEDAFNMTPPDTREEADHMAGLMAETVYSPVHASLRAALLSPPPANPTRAALASQALVGSSANSLQGPVVFNTGRFLVALVIFFIVLGAAIGTDAAGLTNSPTALYGFAGSIFGVVVGYLGAEKP